MSQECCSPTSRALTGIGLSCFFGLIGAAASGMLTLPMALTLRATKVQGLVLPIIYGQLNGFILMASAAGYACLTGIFSCHVGPKCRKAAEERDRKDAAKPTKIEVFSAVRNVCIFSAMFFASLAMTKAFFGWMGYQYSWGMVVKLELPIYALGSVIAFNIARVPVQKTAQ
jgi:hypothetical protein